MKWYNDKMVKSVDGNYYVEIGSESYKDAGRNTYDWSMVIYRKESPSG